MEKKRNAITTVLLWVFFAFNIFMLLGAYFNYSDFQDAIAQLNYLNILGSNFKDSPEYQLAVRSLTIHAFGSALMIVFTIGTIRWNKICFIGMMAETVIFPILLILVGAKVWNPGTITFIFALPTVLTMFLKAKGYSLSAWELIMQPNVQVQDNDNITAIYSTPPINWKKTMLWIGGIIGAILIIPLVILFVYGFISRPDKVSENNIDARYLPIQVNRNGNWSIMDDMGKFVVDDEYSPNCTFSSVSYNGSYWMRQTDKFQLYSVKSPKKPISNDEYDMVTNFYGGRALAINYGSPIVIVDESGKIVAQLSKEVSTASYFNDGMSEITNQNGKKGYIDSKGKIVITPDYEEADEFINGHAIVKKSNDGNFIVINKKGKQTGKYDASQYFEVSNCGENAFLLRTWDNTYQLGNAKGEVLIDFGYKYESISPFIDGYAIVCIGAMDSELGVINQKGELAIRLGKYPSIVNMGSGKFITSFNGKMGVVNQDDDVILDFDYDDILNLRLGNNYIVRKYSKTLIVDSQGNELNTSDLVMIGGIAASHQLRYTDYDALAAEFLKPLTISGFSDTNDKKTVNKICSDMSPKDLHSVSSRKIPLTPDFVTF